MIISLKIYSILISFALRKEKQMYWIDMDDEMTKYIYVYMNYNYNYIYSDYKL